MNLLERVTDVVALVECDPFELEVEQLGGVYVVIRARLWRKDIHTGEVGYGYGGDYLIQASMSDDTIVKKCLTAALSYGEHEVREAFKYKGRRVFGPHMPLDALWEIADDD